MDNGLDFGGDSICWWILDSFH